MQKHSLSRLSMGNASREDRFIADLATLNEPTNDQWTLFITDVCPEGYDKGTSREWKVNFLFMKLNRIMKNHYVLINSSLITYLQNTF